MAEIIALLVSLTLTLFGSNVEQDSSTPAPYDVELIEPQSPGPYVPEPAEAVSDVGPVVEASACQEDEPCWDGVTMGDGLVGPIVHEPESGYWIDGRGIVFNIATREPVAIVFGSEAMTASQTETGAVIDAATLPYSHEFLCGAVVCSD